MQDQRGVVQCIAKHIRRLAGADPRFDRFNGELVSHKYITKRRTHANARTAVFMLMSAAIIEFALRCMGPAGMFDEIVGSIRTVALLPNACARNHS